jgi:hypothetical protein
MAKIQRGSGTEGASKSRGSTRHIGGRKEGRSVASDKKGGGGVKGFRNQEN